MPMPLEIVCKMSFLLCNLSFHDLTVFPRLEPEIPKEPELLQQLDLPKSLELPKVLEFSKRHEPPLDPKPLELPNSLELPKKPEPPKIEIPKQHEMQKQHEVHQPPEIQKHSEAPRKNAVKPKPTASHGGSAESVQAPASPVEAPEDDKIEPLYVHSHKEIDEIVREMLPHFEGKESERNWNAREKSIMTLRRLTRGNAPHDYSQHFLGAFKTLLDGILKVVNSLRTTLAASGCLLIQEVARTCGSGIDPMVEIILQDLIKLCGAMKKISSQTCNSTVDTIFANASYSSRVLQHVWLASQEKNAQLRLFAAGWLKTLINKQARHKSSVEHGGGLELMEKCIKKGLADANPGVRESMRGTFWVFYKVWPGKANEYVFPCGLSLEDRLLMSTGSCLLSMLNRSLCWKRTQRIRTLIHRRTPPAREDHGLDSPAAHRRLQRDLHSRRPLRPRRRPSRLQERTCLLAPNRLNLSRKRRRRSQLLHLALPQPNRRQFERSRPEHIYPRCRPHRCGRPLNLADPRFLDPLPRIRTQLAGHRLPAPNARNPARWRALRRLRRRK